MMEMGRAKRSQGKPESLYPEVEDRLRPLAAPLLPPLPGDWLAEHPERGQTFGQYRAASPVRRGPDRSTIHLCLLGRFTDAQRRVLDLTRDYLALFFDVPVLIRRHLSLSQVPASARRRHPQWGDQQLLTTFILHRMLGPDRPANALAYLALTATDLWPGRGWNFLFGEADFRRRVGVWSIYRNGNPGPGEAAFRLCLRRTLLIATHETGHILTMRHCTAFACLMNGCNSQQERDGMPLPLCPVCLRKLLWNLQAEPVPYLRQLEAFCREHGLDEADWYSRAIGTLDARPGPHD
jgi:archaemetzincin